MSLSMYDVTVPRFNHMMKNLVAMLEKAQAHCDSKKIEDCVLPGCRLIADMWPLTRQVQTVSDQAKGCVSRLAGQTPPSYEDNETTLPQLIERLNLTIAFLETFKPEQINGTEDKEITLELPGVTLKMDGTKYALAFTTPNIYFHLTTAYNILRCNGVEIGKRDYIGEI